MSETSPLSDRPVLVVDFGAQYAQLIARRVREAHVFSEVVPSTMPVAEILTRQPAAIILSGGPASVHVDGAPTIDAAIYESGVPILGICYGAQLTAKLLGGKVAPAPKHEYGRAHVRIDRNDGVFHGFNPGDELPRHDKFRPDTRGLEGTEPPDRSSLAGGAG